MQHVQNDPSEFLRELAKQATLPAFQPRRKYSVAQLKEMIRAERVRDRERGASWTIWRQFYSLEEATSPNRCYHWLPQFREPCCTVIATWVAYHTRKGERICLCNGHMERHLQDSIKHGQQKTAHDESETEDSL